ncbi:MAG: response regulator transcription factor [Acidimicrobiia bacterium]|nr:response regulator transcription factor [Acidimicrobiia bacterium]
MPRVRVLIVDDDVPTRVGVRTILASDPNIEVVGEAGTASQATELYRRLRPDIVLMDVRLPDEDGITVTRRILADEREGPPPRVIVLTTFDYDEYVFRSLQAGASGFLIKRVRAEDLIDAVRTVAAGNDLPAPSRTRTVIRAFADAWTRVESSMPQFAEALSARESEVLALIARGLSNVEIAETLQVSIETVRTHVKHVYLKTGASDRAHAVIIAYESGLAGRPGIDGPIQMD